VADQSSNGYPVLPSTTTGAHPRLRNFELPGINRNLLLRDGSCGFLLVHFTLWYDEELEQIDVGGVDDWGYSSRRIAGSTLWSNHASGTAADLNALQHPMGTPTKATFTYREIVRIHNRLRMYTDCIRWGGDYRSRPDGMHYEIDKSLPFVVKKAQELVATPRGRKICDVNPGLKAIIVS
jgi:hypothetical protein